MNKTMLPTTLLPEYNQEYIDECVCGFTGTFQEWNGHTWKDIE